MIPARTCITGENPQLFRDFEDTGGGAVYSYGFTTGTWTRCKFIDNQAQRGGAVYVRRETEVTIDDCLFVGNKAKTAGAGAVCVATGVEPSNLTICNSDFISNTAVTKGGAVYNHLQNGTVGSTTTMVNCIIAGNSSGEEGGGTCNAEGGSIFNMHNCLLAGNLASGPSSLDSGGGHANRLSGVSTLIHCTVVENDAGEDAGGLFNQDAGSDLIARNCIVWGNTDSGSDTLDAQIQYFSDPFEPDDVDNSVVEGCTDCFETEGGSENNTGDNPDFASGVSSLSWSGHTYDPVTGQTTFNNLSGLDVNEHINKLFKPDNSGVEYLLIISNTATKIVCLGKTAVTGGPGSVFSPFLCTEFGCGSAHAAEDFGDADYLLDAGDPCDLDNNQGTDILNRDLYLNVRDQGDAPDAGVHEVDVP